MRTTTKSLVVGSPGDRSGTSAPALWVTLVSALVALVVLALSATAAQSAERRDEGNTTPLKGGKTWLKIDEGTADALADAGVKVKATGAAEGPTAKRPYFAFPIVGGKVEKDPLGGKIVHSGGLSFSADSTSVVVKSFVIDLDRSVLTAQVAGTGQRIALLKLGAPEGAKVGSEKIVLRGVEAKLTAQAAKALNKAFDTDLFEGGLLIGEATVIAKIGDNNGDNNGKDHDDRDDDNNGENKNDDD